MAACTAKERLKRLVRCNHPLKHLTFIVCCFAQVVNATALDSSSFQFDQLDSPIVAGRGDDRLGWIEADGVDPVRVILQRKQFTTRVGFPNAHGSILTAGNEPPAILAEF